MLELVPIAVDDLDAICDLYRRWEHHWNIPGVMSREEIADDLESPHLSEADIRGVWSGDRLVAIGTVYHRRSGSRLERVIVSGRVDPECRGNGLGRRLLAWQIERAAEKLRECDPSLPWYVRADEYDWIEDAHRLYARMGMHPVRWFEEMARPLSEPAYATNPEGVQIVPWAEVDDEETLRVSNASFADHWGSSPRSPEAWQHSLRSPGTRTDLSFVAVAEGEVVGICLNAHYPQDREATGRAEGWIAHLGVVAEWRGRGVASALIGRSLDAFAEAGFSHALLGVDADSPTGAGSLYRGLGFEPLRRSILSELRIDPRQTENRAFREHDER